MDDKTALKRLHTLLDEKEALKIILPFHACAEKGELVLDRHIMEAGEGSELMTRCMAYADERGHTPGQPGGYTTVAHYRLLPVKRIEKTPGKDNNYTAYADDAGGSQTSGAPVALLARLTEHERG
jgi:hypothetical protein